MNATDAVKEQKRKQCNIPYIDETWVWRYHSMKKGVAPKVSVKGGMQSAKGERLIVVDAITSHGPLRHDPLTALWTYEYNKRVLIMML